MSLESDGRDGGDTATELAYKSLRLEVKKLMEDVAKWKEASSGPCGGWAHDAYTKVHARLQTIVRSTRS